jgi:S1-C subfamily serine protease
MHLKILRDGKEREVLLEVSLLPITQVADYVNTWLGFNTSEITKSLIQRYRLDTSHGVVVTGVEPNSVSGEIGIRAGDVIRQINQERIKGEKNFKMAMAQAAGRDSVLILIQRGQNGYYVTLEP